MGLTAGWREQKSNKIKDILIETILHKKYRNLKKINHGKISSGLKYM